MFKDTNENETQYCKSCLELTIQLEEKEQECENLKSENFTFEELVKTQEEQIAGHNVIIDRFLIASGKSKDITEPEEFEEVFGDIERTYSEREELNSLFQDPEVKVALTDVRTGEREIWRKLGAKAQKYKQALDEVEKTANKNFTHTAWEEYKEQLMQILDIINKAKEN